MRTQSLCCAKPTLPVPKAFSQAKTYRNTIVDFIFSKTDGFSSSSYFTQFSQHDAVTYEKNWQAVTQSPNETERKKAMDTFMQFISEDKNCQPVLTIEDLHTHFILDRGCAKAVDGLSVEIPRAKTVALAGESGCGKTVLAHSILRLVPPPGRIVSGKIVLNGRTGTKVLTELSEKQMCRVRGNEIAMVFQGPLTSLNPVLTIGSQVAEAVIVHQKLSKKQAYETAIEMLQKAGIGDAGRRAQEYPHQLSGGMRQRALLAMALVCNPVLLIADEPTAAVDVTVQAQVLELMRMLQEQMQMTILIITHDLGVIADMADEVIIMYAGKIVEKAGAADIFYNCRHPYTRALLESVPRFTGGSGGLLNVIPGTVPHPAALPVGCSFGPRCKQKMDICMEMPPLKQLNKNHRVRCWLYHK